MSTNPETLLEAMCENASLRKAQTLRLIYAICLEQQDRGSADYSIATIGKLSAERGGPSPAAIRNKPGEDYRALIQACAKAANGKSRKPGKQKVDSFSDGVLEGVVDPVLKVRIKLLLAENEALRGQLLAARHLANQVSVLDLSPSGESEVKQPAPSSPGKLYLTYQEVIALESAISESTLSHWGWVVDEIGRVTTSSGQAVFRAGFATAIKKTVGYVADF